MKQHIMSIAAIAAIFTTGASAFDAQRSTAIAGLETTATAFTPAIMNTTNMVTADQSIEFGAGQTGDALIYPAFYSQKGWSSEFSIINNNRNEAVIVKVVLYSAINTKELRDFNVYLSANDVFRATIKDGKLISNDDSTRTTKQDVVSNANPLITGYTRKDTAEMASATKAFETPIDEPIGYIAVFAMAQSDSSLAGGTSHTGLATYHKKHNQLWQDYRHMLDQCRGDGWRDKSKNYGGIFITNDLSVPNVELNGTNQINSNNLAECGTVYTTQDPQARVVSNTHTQQKRVHFKSPNNSIISGSILVKGDDSKGTRSMLLPAKAIANFTQDNKNVGLLWTEGELASIIDRCIEDGTHTPTVADDVQYNTQCLANDINLFRIHSTNYEFRDAANSQLLVTQPYKRVLVQVADRQGPTFLPVLGTNHGNVTFNRYYSYYNKNVKRKIVANKFYNVTNYGQFDLAQPAIYDDSENLSTSTSDGYVVSPAPILETTPGIPNEVSVFNPLGSYDDSVSGFATINYALHAHGIVTQMSASEVGGNYEVNWIYPVTR